MTAAGFGKSSQPTVGYDTFAADLNALLEHRHQQCRTGRVVTAEGGPHNIAWTHRDEVNGALLGFLAK